MKFKLMFMIIAFSLAFLNVFSASVEIVKTNPAPIKAGEYSDITLRVTNGYGEEFENLYIGVLETDFIIPINNPKNPIIKVEGGEETTKTIRVFFSERLNEGNIILPIFLKHSKGEGIYENEIFIEDSLNLPEIEVGKIESIPNELLKDSLDNKIMITLQNLGERDAELVKADLIIENEFIEESYTYSLADLVSSIKNGSEEELEFTFDILEDIKANSIEAKLNLRYRTKEFVSDNYKTYEKLIPINIKLAKTPDINPIKVEQLSDFKVGTPDNRVKIYIRNDGDKKAEEVRVRLFPDISYPFSFEELSQYVSFSLDQNEETSVIFKAEVFDSAEVRDYPMKVLIESMVGDTRYTQEKEITITTMESKKMITKDNLAYFIFTIAFLFGSYLGIRRYLSKKKTK